MVVASSKEDEIAQALRLPHPFQTPPLLEADLAFAVDLSTGPGADRGRQNLENLIPNLQRSLVSFDRQAVARMSWTVKKVHGKHSPGLLLFWVLLLGWPDLDLLVREIEGCQLLEDIVPSGLYPPVSPDPPLPRASLLALAAV